MLKREAIHYQVCWGKLAPMEWALLWERGMRKKFPNIRVLTCSLQDCFTPWWWGSIWQHFNLSLDPSHSALWINVAFIFQGMGGIFSTPWSLNTIAMHFLEAVLGFLELLWRKKTLPPGDKISEQWWDITYHEIILTAAERGSIWKL